MKFYIYRSKFQGSSLDFEAFLHLVESKRNVEYKIAEGEGKLHTHFKKIFFGYRYILILTKLN